MTAYFKYSNFVKYYVSVLIYSIFLANVKTFLILYKNIRNKTDQSVFTVTSTRIGTNVRIVFKDLHDNIQL